MVLLEDNAVDEPRDLWVAFCTHPIPEYEPKNQELTTVTRPFFSNVNEILAVGRIAWENFDHGRADERAEVSANWITFKKIVPDKDDLDGCDRQELACLRDEILEGKQPSLWELRVTRLFDALDYYQAAYGQNFKTLMRMQLIATWTAFEAFSGDLWEAALNLHPEGLSDLKGRARVLASAHNDKSASRESVDDVERSEGENEGVIVKIPRRLLQQRAYNLEASMGTALRLQFNFTKLDEIRRAYIEAFWKHAQAVHTAINDSALDALSTVRHLLVHNAGVCDLEYQRRSKGIPQIPQLEINEPLPIDGHITKALASAAIDVARRLVAAVDGWLLGHPTITPPSGV